MLSDHRVFLFREAPASLTRYSRMSTSVAFPGFHCFIIDEVSAKEEDWQNEFFQKRDRDFTYAKEKCPSTDLFSKEV